MSAGVETPMVTKKKDEETSVISSEEKKVKIADKFREIMQLLNLDLSNPSLAGTSDRVARMFIDEIFSGLSYENFPAMMTVPNDCKYLDPV